MINETKQLIGVDFDEVGIRLGRFDRKGMLIEAMELSTPQPPVPGAVTVTLCDAIESIDSKHEADFVGIGLPDPISASNRPERVSIDFLGWDSVPFVDWLEPRLKRKVTLGRHVHCALFGEKLFGSARGFQDIVCFALGREIYSAVMVGGKLIVDPNLLGEVSIFLEARGLWGDFGNYNDSSFLKQELNSLDSSLPCSNEIIEKIKGVNSQDQFFVDRLKCFAREFGAAIAPLINEFRPQMVLLEGKLPHYSAGFLSLLQRTLSSDLHSNDINNLKIQTCVLGDGAALLGAAMLAYKGLSISH